MLFILLAPCRGSAPGECEDDFHVTLLIRLTYFKLRVKMPHEANQNIKNQQIQTSAKAIFHLTNKSWKSGKDF
jgi:hypothetical protein